MSKESIDKTAKKLRILLIFLVFIIIGLITIIIVLNSTKSSNISDAQDDTNDQISENEEAERYWNYDYFVPLVNDSAEKAYDNNPENISKAIEVYENFMNKMISQGEYAYAYIVFQNEYTFLDDMGVPAETILDSLTKVDIDINNYVGDQAYIMASMIIEQAEKINNQEIIQKYTKIREAAEPEYNEVVEATTALGEYYKNMIESQEVLND